jgi:hypothetical protein
VRLRAAVVRAALAAGIVGCGAGDDARAPDLATWSLERVAQNPLIRPDTPGLPGHDGANLNGPSVIRVPDWLPNPRGRYYMYFAHHAGKYIRFAHAPSPEGPWTVLPGGVLHVRDTAADGHIASPDVHADGDAREIRMYFHGCVDTCKVQQRSFVATSRDGISFTARPTPLGPSYFRVFRHDGFHYAIALEQNAGVLLRSRDGLAPFERGPALVPRMRHAALRVEGERLVLFYSRRRDAPESIMRSVVPLAGDWSTWRASEPELALAPERDYEGGALPVVASRGGLARDPVRQLRDPALLVDGGAAWLYYSVAGEQGIAAARFVPPAREADGAGR